MWQTMLNAVELCVVGFVVIYITHVLIRRWISNNYGNLLPPGSMGLPYIGEALYLLIPSYSLDLHPFIKTRIQKHGPIFRTRILGQQVIVSSDPEVNNYILQEEGKSVELWYLNGFSKIIGIDESKDRISSLGNIHKYIRNSILKQFGSENIKQKMLPQIQQLAIDSFHFWSTQPSVEVKQAILNVLMNFSAKKHIGYDPKKSTENLNEIYRNVIDGFVSVPLYLPGTLYYKCVKGKEIVQKMLRKIMKERSTCMSCDKHEGDFLDQVYHDMDTHNFLSDNFIVNFIFASLFASSETISSVFPLLLNLLAEHPIALQDLEAEHEAIVDKRKISDSPLTWEEFKSMTFTQQVINETLRLANGSPGLLRRAVKDIPVKGVIIPAGWTIMLVTATQHLNSQLFKDPLEFNPWRWKDISSDVISKNFMPFGRGVRQCPGAEYTRVVMATFLHVMVTKYKWRKVKGGEIVRNPLIGFGSKGIHINFTAK